MIDYDKGTNIFYGIGMRTEWSHIARDLLTDLKKGLGLTNSKAVKKVKISPRKVILYLLIFYIHMILIYLILFFKLFLVIQ